MVRFRLDDLPRDVIARVRDRAVDGWERVLQEEGTLAVTKLRLAGVYDDQMDGFFMLRLRLAGGRLTWQQAMLIGQIAREFARKPSAEFDGPDGFVELTTRQDIQVHWLRFQSLPIVWERLAAAGLTSLQACGDTARNVTGCPLAGVAADQVLDAGPVVEEVNRYVLTQPALTAFLPRKFKITITGCATDCVLARLNDLAFTPARRQGTLGFHVWAGGGLSDYPRVASALDLFVRPADVVHVVAACLRLYQELGDPAHKAVNRFRGLVDELGAACIREEIVRRLPAPLPAAGEDLSTWRACDHLGVQPQAEVNRFSVGLNVPVGRLSGEELIEAGRLARDHGDGQVRVTQRQNVILTGVPAAQLPALRDEPILRRLRPEPEPFERAVVACTSAPFCKFGLFNMKEKGSELAQYLQGSVSASAAERLDGLRLHLSGCKAACAQIHAGHFGLRATLSKDESGFAEAFDVAVAGEVGRGRLAHWVAAAVPVARVFEGIAGVLAAYGAEAQPGEALIDYLARQADVRLASYFAPQAAPKAMRQG